MMSRVIPLHPGEGQLAVHVGVAVELLDPQLRG
jgi:hypothetical protein